MGFLDGIKGKMICRKGLLRHREATAFNEQGRYKEAKKKSDEAYEDYKRAYALGCREPYMLTAKGLIEMREGRFEEAKASFLEADKIKTIKPEERARLRNNYAILLWKMGRLDDAIEQMHIIERAGRTSFVYGTLGYLLIEKGDYDAALKLNLEGLDYDEEDSVVLDNLGQLYMRKGDKEKSLEYFHKAHEQKPSQVDTLYYLAKYAIEDGDKHQAREYLDKALSTNFPATCTVSRAAAQALRDSLDEASAQPSEQAE